MIPVIVCLGRNGDCLNAIPLAKHLADSGEPPAFAVAEEFKSVLESVSYAKPVVIPGRFENLRPALEMLAKQYRVVQAQVYGFGYTVPKPIGQSFCEEVYNVAGFHKEFTHGKFDRIILDNRYPEDEKFLVDNLIGDDTRPIILINYAGQSSPFTFGSQILELIASRFSADCRILDISKLRAKRVGDVLALYERASFLVTTDTATLHLAGACPDLPYIAFIADTPSRWHGSYTRGNCLLRIRYGQYTLWPLIITKLIDEAISKPQRSLRLLHSFHLPPDVGYDTWRRNTVAAGTWRAARTVGNIVPIGLRLEDLPRRFKDGDRDMAYVRDLIDAAVNRCVPGRNDAVMLCNSDTCFSTELYDRVDKAFKDGAIGMWGPRRDFVRIDEPIHYSQIPGGADYPGTDLFIFRPDWWKRNQHLFPDMVLGGEAWDCVFREIMRKQGMPCIKDIIYHERHGSRWERPENRFKLPMQIHNLRLATKALQDLQIGWRPGMFGVRAV